MKDRSFSDTKTVLQLTIPCTSLLAFIYRNSTFHHLIKCTGCKICTMTLRRKYGKFRTRILFLRGKNNWTFILPRESQRAVEVIREISIRRILARGLWPLHEKMADQTNADSVNMKSYFDCLYSLSTNLLSGRHTWKKSNFDTLFYGCIAPKIIKIKLWALCHEEENAYQTCRTRLYCIGEKIISKKRRQSDYCVRGRAYLVKFLSKWLKCGCYLVHTEWLTYSRISKICYPALNYIVHHWVIYFLLLIYAVRL